MLRHKRNMLTCMINACLILLLLVFPLLSVAGGAIREVKRHIRIEKSCLTEMAGRLSHLFGIPVCVEENSSVQFAFGETDVSLEKVLDAFVTSSADYSWGYDNTNKLVNVFPRGRMATNWIFKIQNATNGTLASIIEHKDLELRDRGVSFSYVPERGSDHVVLRAGRYTFRQLLNSLCTQLPWCSHWTMRRAAPGAVFWEAAKRPISLKVHLCSYRRPVEVTATFLGAEPSPVQKATSQSSMRFKVSIQGNDRKASYVLQMKSETGGVRVVEYRDAEDSIVLRHGNCKLELRKGQSKSYELIDFATIKQWLSWPDIVVLEDTTQTDAKLEIKRRDGMTEDIKSLLLKQINQCPVGSRKRMALEAEMRRLDKESIAVESESPIKIKDKEN